MQFADEAKVDFDSIEDGKTFLVAFGDSPNDLMPGRIVPIKDANAVRWIVGGELPRRQVLVTLKGDGDAVITSTQESGRAALDGEPNSTFPSGNGQPGGDFVFKFVISPQ